jgi:hypothetical protein
MLRPRAGNDDYDQVYGRLTPSDIPGILMKYKDK